MITISSDRKMNIPDEEKVIGYEGDNKAEKRIFSVPLKYGDLDLTGMTFKLDTGTNNVIDLPDKVVADVITLIWVVKESEVQTSGPMKIQLRAFAATEEKWHSGAGIVIVKAAINAQNSFPAVLPSEFTEMEARVTEKYTEVKSLIVKTPIIQNGNWYIWDTGTSAYIDTGIAVGGGSGSGSTWYTGTADPTADIGVTGDMYLNTTSWDVFQKETSWTLKSNIKGANGAQGLSAYQIAANDGFVGTESEWLASLKGAKGDPGAQGIQGIQGVAGTGIVNQRTSAEMKLWAGTSAEYTALGTYDSNTVYLISG